MPAETLAEQLKRRRVEEGLPPSLADATEAQNQAEPGTALAAKPSTYKEALVQVRRQEGYLPDGRVDPNARPQIVDQAETRRVLTEASQGKLLTDNHDDLRRLATVTLRLFESGDEQSTEIARSLVSRYPDELGAVYQELGADLGDFYTKPKESTLAKALGVAGAVLKPLDLPLQFAVGLSADIGTGENATPGALLQRLTTYDQAKLNVDRGYDNDGDGYTTYRDIVEKQLGRRLKGPGVTLPVPVLGDRRLDLAGALDLTASVVGDPLTYLTLGAGEAAEVASKMLLEHGAEGARLAAKIDFLGGKALTEVEREQAAKFIKQSIINQTQELAGETINTRKLQSILERSPDPQVRHIAGVVGREGTSGLTKEQIQILERTFADDFTTRAGHELIRAGISEADMFAAVDRKVKKAVKALEGNKHIKFAGKPIPGTDKLRRKAFVREIPVDYHPPVGAIVDEEGIIVRSVHDSRVLEPLGSGLSFKSLSRLDADSWALVRKAEDASATIINGALMHPKTFEYVMRETLARKVLKRIPVLNKLADLNIRPRDAIRKREGRRVAEAVGTAGAKQRARFDRLQEDFLNMLSRPMANAAVELGDRETLNSLIFSYVGKDSPKLAMKSALRADGQEATARLLDRIDDGLKMIYEASVQAGAPEAILRDLNDYFPRVISKEGREIIEAARAGDLPGAVNVLTEKGLIDPEGLLPNPASEIFSEGFLNKREILPDVQDITQVNEAVAAQFAEAGITVKDFYETDALVALAERSRSAFAHSTRMNMLKDLADGLYDDLGRPLVLLADDPAVMAETGRAAAAQGFVPVFSTQGSAIPSRVWAPPEIAQELRQVSDVIFQDAGSAALSRALNTWSRVWATTATVPLLNGGGYHARNAYSNVMLAYLGGLRNPKRYVDAMRLQRKLQKIKLAVQDGWEAQDVFRHAVREGDITQREMVILNRALDDGVLGTGFFGDINREVIRTPGSLRTWWQKQGSIDENLIVDSGKKMGIAIENNARLALYLDQLEKGSTFRAARDHVAKFLFDYADITPFEERLKMVSRFYTFQRKNFGVHLSALVTTPGRVVNSKKITEAWLHLIAGDKDSSFDQRNVPGYLPANTALRGGNLIGLNTGLDDALDTLNAGVSLISLMPGSKYLLPDAVIPDSTLEAFQNVTDLVSGGPIGGLKYLIEGATGRNSFNGGVLRNDPLDRFFALTDTVIPLLSSTAREARYLRQTFGQEAEYENVDGQDGAALRALSWFLGLSTYDVTSDFDRKVLNSLLAEGTDRLSELRRAGVDVPTMDELRQAGRIGRVNVALSLIHQGDIQGAIDILPAKVADAFNLVATPDDGGPATVDDITFKVDQVQQEVEFALGRPLDREEKAQLLLSIPGIARTSEWESLGYEPGRVNRFLRGDKPEVSSDELLGRIEAAAGVLGLSPEEVKAMRPLLTDADRILRDAIEANVPEAELRQVVLDELSKRETAWLFGTDDIPKFVDRSVTPEDLEKIRQKAWQKEATLRLADKVFFGTEPTADEVEKFVLWNVLNKGEQKLIGLEKSPTIPRAKDSRTTDQKLRDALLKAGAARSGPPQEPTG